MLSITILPGRITWTLFGNINGKVYKPIFFYLKTRLHRFCDSSPPRRETPHRTHFGRAHSVHSKRFLRYQPGPSVLPMLVYRLQCPAPAQKSPPRPRLLIEQPDRLVRFVLAICHLSVAVALSPGGAGESQTDAPSELGKQS